MSHFGDHFWGDKNAGFAVLYHNMKHGQLSVKELADFVRERAAVEEAYSKSMQKLSKMVSSGSHLGTFAPMWEMFRVSSDKLALCHLELSKKLHDLIKEINRYGEEQVKVHKKAKEEMSGTLEVIQLLQCSSQLLQKSRDNYCSRFAEQERLRREGSPQKEMDKAELKTRKAAEALRGSVEKYNAVRKEFEEKMLQSAQLFQDTEAAHLKQMKRLVTAYSHSVEDTHVQIGQVQEEFKHNMENVAIDKLIRKFAESNGTGTERPEAVEFEGFRFPTSLEGVKRTWSKPFRIRGLSRREKDAHPVESSESDCVDLPDVDEEGFTIRPDENLTREPAPTCCSSSDSDFDDDDEEPRRFHIEIKPAQAGERLEDKETELKRFRETVGCMIQPPAAVVSVRRQTMRTAVGTGSVSGETPITCQTDKSAVTLSSTSPSTVTNSDSNLACRSHPAHSLFGPLQESVFEADDFSGCRTCTLTSSPSPFSSSSPENVEDSGLDSPFHPFSGPSPDSRPWTPRDDSSTTDSCLVTSFAELQIDITSSNSTEQRSSERSDTWEQKITAPSPPVFTCTKIGVAELFSTSQDSWDTSSESHTNLSAPLQAPCTAPRTQRGNNLMAPFNPSLLTPGSLSSTSSDRGLFSPPSLNVGISRGPSPVILGSQESLPVAAAFTEYVHAVFEEGELEGSGVRISGELTMSFPGGILRVFGGSTPPPVLSFRLVHTSDVEHYMPNSDLLYSDLSQSDHSCKDFWLNMPRLTCHLQNLAEQHIAPYYNVVLLKYQVFKPGKSAVPLHLASSWNCSPTSTEFSMEYMQNMASLCDIHILLPLDETVSNLQFDPPARCSERRLLWQIPNASSGKETEGGGRLYARWQPLRGCSTPTPAAAQFTCEGRTLSGVDIELVGSGYRMSLVKKRFAAGKYLVC